MTMSKLRFSLLISGVLFFILSCGTTSNNAEAGNALSSGNTAITPANETEKAILQKIASAQQGKAIAAGSSSFTVLNEYFAASGRVCKSVSIVQTSTQIADTKTICNFNGSWGYTPDVLPPVANRQ